MRVHLASLLVGAAACGGAATLPDEAERPVADATAPDPAPPEPSEPVAPAATEPPCPKSPCTARPVIFIHGHNGSSSDGKELLDAMMAPGERWDERTLAGTADHADWAARSIPRRAWLFAFDYYVKKGTDPRGSFTAGPGRIGSNREHACAAPSGAGFLRPTKSVYDEGIEHDFASDLARFVDDVLRATGATKVDILTHSMGGLVTRSFVTFLGGAEKVESILFLATPHLGVPFAAGEGLLGKTAPWMTAHELTELDRNSVLAKSSFVRCGEVGEDTWPAQLLASEDEVATLPKLHCMRGAKDILVSAESGRHPRCLDHVEVPDTDHGGLLRAKEAAERARLVLGGFVTASSTR